MPTKIAKTDKMELPGVSQPFWNTRRFSSKNSTVSQRVRTEELERNLERVRKYMTVRNTPPWYRGMSRPQYDASNELLYSLRDDSSQLTTHRTAWCLKRMGLRPMIKSHEIWFLIQLSQQSDIAFIWFLMEIHYKTKQDEEEDREIYSINEQILLSCLSHLDMITTFRGLNNVLPRPQPPKYILQKRRQREELKRQQALEEQKKGKLRKEYVMPYFSKQVYPVQIATNLVGVPRDFKVRMPLYDSWRNHRKVVLNESKRWFTEYKLGTKVTNQETQQENDATNERMHRLQEGFEAVQLSPDTLNGLQLEHKEIDNLEESLHNQLNVIMKEACSDLINKETNVSDAKERIRMQLEKDVDKYMKEFRKEAAHSRKECIRKTLQYQALGFQSECRILRSMGNSCSQSDEHLKNAPLLSLYNAESINECQTDQSATAQCSWVSQLYTVPYNGNKLLTLGNNNTSTDSGIRSIQVPGQRDVTSSLSAGCLFETGTKRQTGGTEELNPSMRFTDTQTQSAFNQKTEEVSSIDNLQKMDLEETPFAEEENTPFSEEENTKLHWKSPESLLKIESSLLDFREKYISKESLATAEAEKFFKITDDTQMPYKFDYRKIFFFKQNTEENLNIRRALINAIDSDIAMLNRLSENSNMAINYYVEKLFKNAPELKAEKVNTKDMLGYTLDYYDPDDEELMEDMLKKALQYLATNPKYVFAGLPLAHQHPMLREFIRLRYGKRYTRKEQSSSWEESRRVLFALRLLDLHVNFPRYDASYGVGTDYSNHDEIIKMHKSIKRRFFRNIDTAILSRARIYWFTMRPLLCSPPVRLAFFSYIPGAPRDFPYFRPYQGKFK